MNARSRFFASFDEARQLVHAAVLRSTVEHGVFDARFACLVLRHRSELYAPAGWKPLIALVLGHLTPAFLFCGLCRSEGPRGAFRRLNYQEEGRQSYRTQDRQDLA